eukprot:COSAG06_NODE_137_length_22365_cov_49.346313_11_plen_189_part_00
MGAWASPQALIVPTRHSTTTGEPTSLVQQLVDVAIADHVDRFESMIRFDKATLTKFQKEWEREGTGGPVLSICERGPSEVQRAFEVSGDGDTPFPWCSPVYPTPKREYREAYKIATLSSATDMKELRVFSGVWDVYIRERWKVDEKKLRMRSALELPKAKGAKTSWNQGKQVSARDMLGHHYKLGRLN